MEYMELECWVLHGHFGPVYLLQTCKNDENIASWNNLALQDCELDKFVERIGALNHKYRGKKSLSWVNNW